MSNEDLTFVGQRVLVECIFRLNGVPTDPTIVSVTSRSPISSTQSSLVYPNENLIRRADGEYEAAVIVDEPGQWVFRAEGAGIVDTVYEIRVDVEESGIL